MVVFGTRAKFDQRRRELPLNGVIYYKGEWMESGESSELSPTIFLAEQPPNERLQSHLHRENQFQLFVSGGGAIGSRAISPGMIHYAGAYTGYGPIDSGPEGIKYFTIRPAHDIGMTTLDRASSEMPRGPKRHATSSPVEISPVAVLSLLSTVAEQIAIPKTTGLGASVFRLPPHASLPYEHIEGSIGAFIVVQAGTIQATDQTLAEWESIFLSHGEEMAIKAGDQGAQVAVMWSPPKDAAYKQFAASNP